MRLIHHGFLLEHVEEETPRRTNRPRFHWKTASKGEGDEDGLHITYQFNVTDQLEHGREYLPVERVHMMLEVTMTQNLNLSTNHVDDQGMKKLARRNLRLSAAGQSRQLHHSRQKNIWHHNDINNIHHHHHHY